jgi:hypothetical protein
MVRRARGKKRGKIREGRHPDDTRWEWMARAGELLKAGIHVLLCKYLPKQARSRAAVNCVAHTVLPCE